MTHQIALKLHFLHRDPDRAIDESRSRGYLSHVVVEVNGGVFYPVIFFNVDRFQQELEYEVSRGRPFLAYPGLIVLSEVTRSNMEQAVNQLAQDGYFDRLAPISQDWQTIKNSIAWPP